jgi:hypothetical protein
MEASITFACGRDCCPVPDSIAKILGNSTLNEMLTLRRRMPKGFKTQFDKKGLAALKPDKGWQRRFDHPIPVARGKELVTLRDAALYITKLPKAEQQIEEWQTAVEALILVAESKDGPTMLARIGVMKALNRHVVREFNPDRKPHHWGKRKLKRDE